MRVEKASKLVGDAYAYVDDFGKMVHFEGEDVRLGLPANPKSFFHFDADEQKLSRRRAIRGHLPIEVSRILIPYLKVKVIFRESVFHNSCFLYALLCQIRRTKIIIHVDLRSDGVEHSRFDCSRPLLVASR